MKGLTDIPGIRVGHVSDFQAVTGCTAILCTQGAVGGVDIRGSASGTEETPLLDPGHLTQEIHGILLSGGSAFGLEAASGVRRYLARQGVGFETGAGKVPLVPAAIIFDLPIIRNEVRPTVAMGEAAAAAATDEPVKEGSVGAGTGATVGKIMGLKHAMKSGVGSFTVTLPGGVLVSTLAVVNAFGDVRDPATGKIVAGARTAQDGADFVDTQEQMKRGAGGGFAVHNTTLVVVATNVRLTKVQAKKLAEQGSLGMARTIFPVNTMFDGDLVFALSLGDRKADINVLGVAAAEAVAQSIVRAVRFAKTLGGVPGLG
jgi:L-aminopeptidase/D-esterase-like protein